MDPPVSGQLKAFDLRTLGTVRHLHPDSGALPDLRQANLLES